MKYIKESERIWDKRSENNDIWSVPVTSEEIRLAKEGKWSIVLTPRKPVPSDWFPPNLSNKKILCLASGGGQQGPILAAAGADVTVLDNSKKQLEKDDFVAKRDNLVIKTVQGNMQELSMFEDEIFDCIIHPWSNGYVDDILSVWQECGKVLKRRGCLLAGFGNPIEYIFNADKLTQGIFEVENSIPYADIEHMDDEKVRAIAEEDGYIWSHTLEEQMQGQIEAGFAIIGFYEDIGGTALDKYINSSIATRAIKI